MAINQKLYADVIETVKKYKNEQFLIITHVNPDGDTIGSALAMAHILKQLHVTFQIVNEDQLPKNFLFLPMASEIKIPDQIQGPFDHIITVDCADYQRIGEKLVTKLTENPQTLINIDHHPTNDNYGTLNIVDADAASTTFILYNLCKEVGIQLTYDLAICLYTGIMTDTGSFKYSNTTAEIHHAAADLMDYGIQAYDVVEKIFETNTLEKLMVLKNSLQTLVVDETGKIAWIDIVEDRTGEQRLASDVEGLVNYPRSIDGVEVAISFKEVDANKVKVGLRSKKYIDVSVIAKQFHGGGHMRAAGCTVHKSLDMTKKLVINEIQKYV